jgi:hypothetical protein
MGPARRGRAAMGWLPDWLPAIQLHFLSSIRCEKYPSTAAP